MTAPTGSTAGTTTGRPLRADAQRNRDAVVTAAAAAFSEHGVDTSLEDIARQAGVGIGTLYRHFPTRGELVMAVYRQQVEQVVGAADALAAEHDPAEALRRWMLHFVDYAASKRGLAGALKMVVDDDTQAQFAELKQSTRRAADGLLTTAAAAGQVRGDVSAEDLIKALGGICMSQAPVDSDTARRLAGLVFDGLRFGAAAS